MGEGEGIRPGSPDIDAKSPEHSMVEQDDWEEEEVIASAYSDGQVSDSTVHAVCGHSRRPFSTKSKGEICRPVLLTRLKTCESEVTELVNVKSKGFLLYCNLYLYQLFRRTEHFFLENVFTKRTNTYLPEVGDIVIVQDFQR